jgi:hypothetical protein
VQRYGEDLFYDTFIAYDIKYRSHKNSIMFKLNIDGSVVENAEINEIKTKRQ